jgi:threonyl-tRNA synthetase
MMDAQENAQDDTLYKIRHSLAHVMAQAILDMRPGSTLGFGPPISDGFYYDFILSEPLTEEDFPQIEKRMKRIIKQGQNFEREELSAAEALSKIEEMGEPYKMEYAQELLDKKGLDGLSFYTNGPFLDMCEGPHVENTRKIPLGAFKIRSLAGAYWRGDSDNVMMTRVYVWAFESKEELESHIRAHKEALARDHKKLGRELGLFHIDEMVGQGLILWTPKGSVVRNELQNFIGEELTRQGYHQVYTPHIGKLDLYRTSGHYPYYQESQYPPLVDKEQMEALVTEGATCGHLANLLEEGGVEGYLLKPMNCPHHIKIYDSQAHSYRDLPLRLAEFGTVYRWEQSGEISGMTRVRGFTQDDAHLFCTEDQVAEELLGCIKIVQIIFDKLGMDDYRVRVGLRDPDSEKYVGDSECWDKAEDACRQAALTLGVPFTEEPGEAAFYGPKIDFVVKDVLGREWQLGTVQVDYNLPERFDLSYKGSDGNDHRPVMIHRAPFGSMERFIGVLIEHFGGAFPTWLTPLQVKVVSVGEKFADYADSIVSRLREHRVRVDHDASSDTMGKKIRNAITSKIPNILVVGEREETDGSVTLRCYGSRDQHTMSTDEFETRLLDAIKNRSKSLM